jgi:ankyrin repeat protein
MSINTTSRNSVTNVRQTVPSVMDLIRGDVPQLLAWMASKHYTDSKLVKVLLTAVRVGRIDICLAIINRRRLANNLLTETVELACYSNQLTLAKIIVERYRLSLKFHHLYNALLGASSIGHSEVVQWLLGVMKLSHDDSVTWLLATASARGDIDTVKLLTAQTASQAIHDTSHALRCACYRGRGHVVEWLMANTASSVSKLGDLVTGICSTMTSLTAACYSCHADVVKTLLHCVTPHTVNIQCGIYNNSALHSVIWNSRDPGESRLQTACANNDIEEVNTFLYTDDVNVQDNSGDTSLHEACRYGNVEVVECLLSVFANVNITNDSRRTPVEQAEYYGNDQLVPGFSQLLPRPAEC